VVCAPVKVFNGAMTTAISTHAGVLVGALTTYLIQKQSWVRETRRQVYASFIGECRIWFDSIERVTEAIQRDFPASEREPHWDRANAGRARVFGLRAQIDLLGGKRPRNAALALEQNIGKINEKIYIYDHDREHPPNTGACRKEFDRCLDEFRRAASVELNVSKPEPSS
jgi:hypothetical protein